MNSVRKAESGENIISRRETDRFFCLCQRLIRERYFLFVNFSADALRVPEEENEQIENVRSEYEHILSASPMIVFRPAFHRERNSDLALFDQTFHRDISQIIAPRMGDRHFRIVLPDDLDNLVRVLKRGGHRLLAVDVTSVFRGFPDLIKMLIGKTGR